MWNDSEVLSFRERWERVFATPGLGVIFFESDEHGTDYVALVLEGNQGNHKRWLEDVQSLTRMMDGWGEVKGFRDSTHRAVVIEIHLEPVENVDQRRRIASDYEFAHQQEFRSVLAGVRTLRPGPFYRFEIHDRYKAVVMQVLGYDSSWISPVMGMYAFQVGDDTLYGYSRHVQNRLNSYGPEINAIRGDVWVWHTQSTEHAKALEDQMNAFRNSSDLPVSVHKPRESFGGMSITEFAALVRDVADTDNVYNLLIRR